MYSTCIKKENLDSGFGLAKIPLLLDIHVHLLNTCIYMCILYIYMYKTLR